MRPLPSALLRCLRSKCRLVTTVSLPRSSVVSVSVPPCIMPKHNLANLCTVERDLYPRRWGLGPQASEKKKLKASGKLDKYGRPNEATPAAWKSDYKDYNAPLEDQPATAPAAAADVSMSEAPAAVAETPSAALVVPVVDDKKKRKKNDGETAEEKAERKRLKAEKKAAKKARRASKGGEDNDSDSD